MTRVGIKAKMIAISQCVIDNGATSKIFIKIGIFVKRTVIPSDNKVVPKIILLVVIPLVKRDSLLLAL